MLIVLVFLHLLVFSEFEGGYSYKTFPTSSFMSKLEDLYSSSFFHRIQRAELTKDENLPLQLLGPILKPGQKDFEWLSKADMVTFIPNYFFEKVKGCLSEFQYL